MVLIMSIKWSFPLSRMIEVSKSGPGGSKLTTSLVDISLKFQKLISNIRQYVC